MFDCLEKKSEHKKSSYSYLTIEMLRGVGKRKPRLSWIQGNQFLEDFKQEKSMSIIIGDLEKLKLIDWADRL